jgi:hypothetical protein
MKTILKLLFVAVALFCAMPLFAQAADIAGVPIPAELLTTNVKNIQLNGLTVVMGVMILGRIYKALRNGGGIVGAWRGLLYGTNTPVPSPSPASPSTPGKLSALVLFLGFSVVLVTGCAGPRERRDNITPATIIEGDLRKGKFRFESPKNSEGAGIVIETQTNGATRIQIDRLKTVVDPNLIAPSYTGEVERINADANRLEKVINATGTAGGKLLEGAGVGAGKGMNTAVTGKPPTSTPLPIP